MSSGFVLQQSAHSVKCGSILGSPFRRKSAMVRIASYAGFCLVLTTAWGPLGLLAADDRTDEDANAAARQQSKAAPATGEATERPASRPELKRATAVLAEESKSVIAD